MRLQQPGSIKRLLKQYLGDRYILVVDPSENIRSSIRQFLINLEVQRIRAVATTREARQIMTSTDIAILIIEWFGDGTHENGLRFCREMRKSPQYREIPMLLLTTEGSRADVVLASEVGVDLYLLKPFTFEEFTNKINTLIKRQLSPDTLQRTLDEAESNLAISEHDEARELFFKALQAQPKSAKALAGLGKVALEAGRREEALRHLREAISLNSEYLEAYRLLHHVLEESGDVDGQLQIAGKLHAMSPDNPRYHLILARLYLEKHNLEKSERHFRRCLSLSPRMAAGQKGLGDVAVLREDYQKAARHYRKALDLDCDDISTLNALGLTHVRLGNFDEGIRKYKLALRLDPRNAKILFNLGHAEEKRGRLTQAMEYYKQALSISPTYDKAQRGHKRVSLRLRCE